MISHFWKVTYLPYFIGLSILLLCLIEAKLNGLRGTSISVLVNRSKSSNYNIIGFLFEYIGFYSIAFNFISYGYFSQFRGLLGGINLTSDLELPVWLNGLLCLLTIDFAHYWLHRLYHKSDLLYNCHSFHHSATEMSIFMAYRVHILQYLVKSRYVLLVLWGPTHALFYTMVFRDIFLLTNHMRWDSDWGILGKVFVSPYFHKVHHNQKTMRSNFGAVFSFWDRIFNTDYKGKKITKLENIDNEFEQYGYLYGYILPILKIFKFKS